MAVHVLQDVAPRHRAFEDIDIGSVAFCNQDKNPDPSRVKLKKRIFANAAVLS